MGSRGILYILLSIAIAIVPIACGNGLDIIPGPYSDAFLNGVWFVEDSPDDTMGYFVADGLGNIVDHSYFFSNSPSGTYSVTNAGSFAIDIDNAALNLLTLEGKLISNIAGRVTSIDGSTISSIGIDNVPDTSTLSGTISGTLEQNCNPADTTLYKNICDAATYNVTGMSVDSSGAVTSGTITNTTDDFSVFDAGAYSIGSDVVIFLHTSEFAGPHAPYRLIKIIGTISGSVISGTYELADDLDGPVGIANLTL